MRLAIEPRRDTIDVKSVEVVGRYHDIIVMCKADDSMYRKPVYVGLICHVTDHVTRPNWPPYNSTNPRYVYSNKESLDAEIDDGPPSAERSQPRFNVGPSRKINIASSFFEVSRFKLQSPRDQGCSTAL